MSIPSPRTLAAARAASSRLADRNTPFVFDEWYVAAFGEELGWRLTARKILGKRVVLYRTEAGVPVALEDRCAHRSYPLSAGTLEGDTVVCGYHGFRYNTEGDCIEAPSQAKCPKDIGVRAYPLIERGSLVWIWMGDPALADPARLPAQEWIVDPDWAKTSGYFRLPGNYVSLHENLLDLTHLSYLHAKSFGTPDYARAPFEITTGDGHFALERAVSPTTLPPVWAKPTGLSGISTAARIALSEFVSPAFHQVGVTFYDTALPEANRKVSRIRTAHLITPETQGSTHYFLVHGRDFGQHDPALGAYMHEQLFAAFQEDVDGLSLLEEVLEEADETTYEISVQSDAPALAMRQYLKTRAEAASARPPSDARVVGLRS